MDNKQTTHVHIYNDYFHCRRKYTRKSEYRNPLTATDEDADDTLTYTLSGTDATSFNINSTNGQLTTKIPLNYSTQNIYTVTVTATDTAGSTDTISVTINIIGPVVFSDTALAAAVRSALRIGSNAKIYPDPLAALTGLTATDKGITDLTGLEEATGLNTLDLADNEIVNLNPLSDLTTLQTLDLADNLITNVFPLPVVTTTGNRRLQMLATQFRAVLELLIHHCDRAGYAQFSRNQENLGV